MAHILVMDDDLTTRRFLRDILEKYLKHTVSEASTVENALEQTRLNRFDLMLLDQHLPDGNAVDFCHTLARDRSQQDIPKWIITGEKPLEEDSLMWQQLRVAGHLVKPFHIEHVLRVVEQCLRTAKS
jgi:DNA-binding response OmpR family regulator